MLAFLGALVSYSWWVLIFVGAIVTICKVGVVAGCALSCAAVLLHAAFFLVGSGHIENTGKIYTLVLVRYVAIVHRSDR